MLISDIEMEIVDNDPSTASMKDVESCNLVNLLTQLCVKIEETNISTNSPRDFDPSKIRAGDGSYYISQILKKIVGKKELTVDELSSSIISPRKMNEERFAFIEQNYNISHYIHLRTSLFCPV